MLAGVNRRLTGLIVVAALAGCSSGDEGDEPKSAKGAPKAVGEAIDRLERAAVGRDFGVICNDLFTDDARERAGGDDCAKLLRATTKEIREPAIRVLSIRVEGDTADVRVRSSAEDQGAVEETIELVRDGQEYRIEALGD